VAKAAAAAHAMQVCLTVLGEVKVDHDIDALDVNATGEQICSSSSSSTCDTLSAADKHQATLNQPYLVYSMQLSCSVNEQHRNVCRRKARVPVNQA
jgi:hypothetical protein